jgi:glycosyltransferase involved in cell wall biosynthesis
MEDPSPKITILLATFNRSTLVGETLDSIIAQTYHNWECIIVDDHSKDNTEVVISSYLEKEPRFSYFRKTEKYKPGLSGTRNYGLDLAAERGAEFVQFFDDDDIMHPRKLELKIKPFLKDPSLDLTICCYRKFHSTEVIDFDLEKANDQSCTIRTNNLLKSFYLNKINLNSPGPLWKAEVLSDYRFNEDLNYAEEREYYLRIFLNEELKFYPVEEILFWYRKHDKAITSNLYKKNRLKEQSLELMRKSLQNEILGKKNAEFFLIKSLVGEALKTKDKTTLFGLKSYLKKHSNSLNIKCLILLIKVRLRSL